MSKEGARKTSKALVVSILPDVCLTPIGNIMVPIPYMIVANLEDSISVSKNVRFGGRPVFLLDQSIITKTTGAEAGTGGGVKSGTTGSIVEPIEGSKNVRVNGKRVVRHGDLCKMNNGNTLGRVVFYDDGESEIQTESPKYDEMFRLVDDVTGEPLVDFEYRLKTESGEIIKGRTDSNGYTMRITRDKPEKIYLVENNDDLISRPQRDPLYPLILVQSQEEINSLYISSEEDM